MTLKSLSDLEPIAKELPQLLKAAGRIVIVDLHPAFFKPAGRRSIEVYEDPRTDKQQIDTSIKVKQYLNIKPSQSEAVRGQREPLTIYHRPFSSLLTTFFSKGMAVDAIEEPAFNTKGGDPAHPHSYHNFPQFPMLLAFRLRHAVGFPAETCCGQGKIRSSLAALQNVA